VPDEGEGEPVEKKIELPKWPGLLVTGKSVTRGQAAEIILRTTDMYFVDSLNDEEWRGIVRRALGIEDVEDPYNTTSRRPFADRRKAMKDFRVVPDVEFLHNHRIASSWIGGVHGWCNWDGTIHASNYNIGKWPSLVSVEGDLKEIAKAFPFLDMKVQLLTGEICEEGTKVAVGYTVRGGKVTRLASKKKITAETDLTVQDLARRFSGTSERGCTEEYLLLAIEHVRTRLGVYRSPERATSPI
jgi:hypothetical protein